MTLGSEGLDKLDIRILRGLTHGTHEGLAWGELSPSYKDLGKKLGVTRETVRGRVEKMSRSGFLKVFPIQVNPNLLGVSVGALSVDVPHTVPKKELAEKLSLIEGMLIVAAHVGSMIGMIFYYEDQPALDKKVDLIARICGVKDSKFTTIPYPSCSLELNRKDWEVVSALQHNRAKSSGQVAARMGISARTLKRRTKRLIDGMAISTMFSADLRALPVGVLGGLQVEYADEADRSETDRKLMLAFEGQLVYSGLWSRFSVFGLILPSMPAASEALERAQRTRGVASARLELIEERLETYSAFNELVERRLRMITPRAGVQKNRR